MLEELLREGFEQLKLPLAESSLSAYHAYCSLLEEKNAVMNLTAITGEDNVAKLHFLDCAALLTLDSFKGKKVIDVGTGAGFPGLALKIAEPELKLVLLDSLEKRVNFLKDVCEAVSLKDVECIHARAEESPAEYRAAFDVAVSRAVARMNVLCEMCLPFVKKNGLFIAMKGPDCEEELNEAKHAVHELGAKVEKVVKYTIPCTDIVHSAILVRKIGETPKKYPRRWAQIKKQPL